MARRNLNDLLAFVTVAREGSFTRAAAVLGVTQSALSQAIRGLEDRLDIRLLTRTTRSVSPTAAGERLANAIGHRFDEIEAELDALTELRDKPAGTVRITCGDTCCGHDLLPKLAPLLREYPDITLEFDMNYGFRDIVADRFDAGVRLGEHDRQGHDRGADRAHDAHGRRGIASVLREAPAPTRRPGSDAPPLHQPAAGCQAGSMRGNSRAAARVEGARRGTGHLQHLAPALSTAALDGLGIAFLPEDEFAPHLEEGRLVRVLEDWCPPFPGFHLYYPSRRHPSPAFSLVLDALRYRRDVK